MRKTWPALLAVLLVLAGCAGLPQKVQKSHSQSLADPAATSLGRRAALGQTNHNLSGIHLLASGEEALASRIALADHAEKTLDIQYYILHDDDSTRTLLRHVRQAAERGVRVRVLVDDLNTAGEDRRFLHLSERENIEVRVFNPFPGGRSATWSRILASLNELPRINHRMHNKLFVADNALAITGGRNVGDAYFTRDKDSNFIDLDVVAGGPIVQELSSTFDAFWNSKYAYPIALLAGPDPSGEQKPPLEETDISAEADWLAHALEQRAVPLPLLWVPATVLADGPAKIASDEAPDEKEAIANNLQALMRSAKQELLVISAYFVPGEEGMAMFRELAGRGVHIHVLTNSLASTDSPVVHIGYSRYRVELLKLGVQISEVRPKPGQGPRRLRSYRSSHGSSQASLHAKALVIDQRTVFIGSMNLDGRSRKFNSELGLVIRSPEIARQVAGIVDDIDADDSYRLSLVGKRKNKLEWTSGEGDDMKTWHTDPETTTASRVILRLLAPFAPEELL